MVVPLFCAILLKLSPALTVTVVFEVLLEIVVVLLLGLVALWLEPETLSTCPSLRSLLERPFKALSLATVVLLTWAISPSVSPALTVTVPVEDFAVLLLELFAVGLLEPETFRTCPNLRSLLERLFSDLRAATVVLLD